MVSKSPELFSAAAPNDLEKRSQSEFWHRMSGRQVFRKTAHESAG
jgi:hypothetical protein